LPLLWSQVDLKAGAVRLEVNSTKNNGERLIYLPQDLLDLVEGQMATNRPREA
jgi:integrase